MPCEAGAPRGCVWEPRMLGVGEGGQLVQSLERPETEPALPSPLLS